MLVGLHHVLLCFQRRSCSELTGGQRLSAALGDGRHLSAALGDGAPTTLPLGDNAVLINFSSPNNFKFTRQL